MPHQKITQALVDRLAPFVADHRRLSAWGPVRRAYRELVVLRDTLRARLLGARKAPPPPASAWEEVAPPVRSVERQCEDE